MAPQRPLTPEKQLLNLIEDPKSKGNLILQAQAVKYRSLGFLSLPGWLGRASFFKERAKRWFSGMDLRRLNIQTINNILEAGTIILAVYFAFNFTVSLLNLKKIPSMELKGGTDAALSDSGVGSGLKQTLSYYLEKVRERNIFDMKNTKVASTSESSNPQAPGSRLIQLTQDLKLVGISWSSDPDAMIEDTKNSRTFFIKTGQMIGEVKVQAIFKDKIVLRYGAEETELR